MDVGTPLPTLSQMRNWDTEHLSQAADDWEADAQRWETTYEENFQRLVQTDWKGQAQEAALERAGLDLVKVRGPAWQLREAATAARYGFAQQNGAKGWALDAVSDAEQAGFSPTEDLSVSDRVTGGSAATRAARQAQAQALAAQSGIARHCWSPATRRSPPKSPQQPATSANSASTSTAAVRVPRLRRKPTGFNSLTTRLGSKTRRHHRLTSQVCLPRVFVLLFRESWRRDHPVGPGNSVAAASIFGTKTAVSGGTILTTSGIIRIGTTTRTIGQIPNGKKFLLGVYHP